MHPSFAAFRRTPLAHDLDRLIEGRDRYLEFVALSRAGLPAVTALVDDLRRRGHVVVKPRARVPGVCFAYGALFSPEPRPAPEGAWDAFFAQGPADDFPERLPQPPTPAPADA